MASTVAAAGPPARVNCAAARTTAARTRALRGLALRPGCTVWVTVAPCVPSYMDTMSSILLFCRAAIADWHCHERNQDRPVPTRSHPFGLAIATLVVAVAVTVCTATIPPSSAESPDTSSPLSSPPQSTPAGREAPDYRRLLIEPG